MGRRLKFPSLLAIFQDAQTTLHRFPLPLAASWLAGAIFMFSVKESNFPIWLGRLAINAMLAISLLLGASLLSEKSPRWFNRQPGWLIHGFGVALILVYYFFSLDDFNASYMLRYLQLALAMHLFVAFAVYSAFDEQATFWEFNKQLFIRFVTSTIFAGVLFAGLACAIAAIDALFSFKIQGETYLRLWLVVVFVFFTWHFLSGVPKPGSLSKQSMDFPKVLKVFSQYLLLPLVILYLGILYIYMGKILITWDWPKGLVAWLVSTVATVGVFNILLLHPLSLEKNQNWFHHYRRIFFLVILPLLTMLFISLGKRISEYGITERRYFLASMGIWLAGISLYFLFSKSKNIQWIPKTLAILALITAFGPWGAYSVSEYNQVHQLQKLLVKHNLFQNGKIIVPTTRAETNNIPFEDQKKISGIIDYLIKNHGPEAIQPWFEKPLPRKETPARSFFYSTFDTSAEQIVTMIGLPYINSWQGPNTHNRFTFYSLETDLNFPISLENYQFLAPIRTYSFNQNIQNQNFDTRIAKLQPSSEISKATLEFFDHQNKLGEITLNDFIAKLIQNYPLSTFHEPKISRENLTLEFTDAQIHGKLIINNISGE
jgi:hypothetical protein